MQTPWLAAILMMSVEYRTNSRRPRTDLCGRPQRRLCKVDRAPENAMSWVLSVRNEATAVLDHRCRMIPEDGEVESGGQQCRMQHSYSVDPATSPAGCQQRRWCHRWLSPFLLREIGVGWLNRWHKVTLSEVSRHLFSHDSLDNLRHKRQVGDRSVVHPGPDLVSAWQAR